MVPYGRVWSHIVQFGPIWSCMVPDSQVQSCMVMWGPLWSLMVRMVPYVLIWSCLVQFGPVGPVWSHLVPYEISDNYVSQHEITQDSIVKLEKNMKSVNIIIQQKLPEDTFCQTACVIPQDSNRQFILQQVLPMRPYCTSRNFFYGASGLVNQRGRKISLQKSCPNQQ